MVYIQELCLYEVRPLNKYTKLLVLSSTLGDHGLIFRRLPWLKTFLNFFEDGLLKLSKSIYRIFSY